MQQGIITNSIDGYSRKNHQFFSRTQNIYINICDINIFLKNTKTHCGYSKTVIMIKYVIYILYIYVKVCDILPWRHVQQRKNHHIIQPNKRDRCDIFVWVRCAAASWRRCQLEIIYSNSIQIISSLMLLLLSFSTHVLMWIRQWRKKDEFHPFKHVSRSAKTKRAKKRTSNYINFSVSFLTILFCKHSSNAMPYIYTNRYGL